MSREERNLKKIGASWEEPDLSMRGAKKLSAAELREVNDKLEASFMEADGALSDLRQAVAELEAAPATISRALDNNGRFDNYDKLLAAGSLVRQTWGDGVETACMLLAIAPEVMVNGWDVGYLDRCPASLMPQWLVPLVPLFDDYGSLDSWDAMARRFSKLGRGFHKLIDQQWDKLELEFKVICIEEAKATCTLDSEIAAYDVAIEYLRSEDNSKWMEFEEQSSCLPYGDMANCILSSNGETSSLTRSLEYDHFFWQLTTRSRKALGSPHIKIV